MFFNSLDFAIFLPIVLLGYYALSRRFQNIFLLIASYIFYGWWNWRFLFLIFISTVVDYICGIGVHAAIGKTRRKFYLLLSIATNLSILGFFKYFNFFSESLVKLFCLIGLQVDVPTLRVILPVGISFYTFQTMAYTIDVHRGKITPVHNLIDFALYVAFFPQLVAGPIERPENLLPQIRAQRNVSEKQLAEGVLLIMTGLFRKIVIADVAAGYVNRCFGFPDTFSSLGLLIGVWLFALQIYADFCGYTDIARGVSKLLGIELMENFQQPYFSANVTEFWRRWHISLSSWLKDYLYIPLGGNRKGRFNTYRNLMITMLLGGLWHGASWTFVAWGGLHGIYLSAHKWIMTHGGRKVSRDHKETFGPIFLVKVFLTFNLVCLAWVFFRAASFENAMSYLTTILSFKGPWIDLANPGKILEPMFVFFLLLSALLLIDIPQFRSDKHNIMLRWNYILRGAFYAGLLIGIMLFAGQDETPFIYFQF